MLGAEHTRSLAPPEGLAASNARTGPGGTNRPRGMIRRARLSSLGMSNGPAPAGQAGDGATGVRSRTETLLRRHYHGRPAWERRIQWPPAHVTSYPEWLRPRSRTGRRGGGVAASASSTGRGGSGSGCAPSTAATPPWSTSGSPPACSSSARAGSVERRRAGPSLWFVAALIFPLVFRRRAPMTVFLVIAAVAFVQWLVTGPALADVVAPRRALHGRARVGVAAGGGGRRSSSRPASSWPRCAGGRPATTSSPSCSSPGSPSPRCWPGSSCARCAASSTGWPSGPSGWSSNGTSRRRWPRPTERARIAREMHDVVSHNIQVMVTLADAAARAQACGPCPRRRGDARGLEHGPPGADRHAPHARRAAGGSGRRCAAERANGDGPPVRSHPSRACATSMRWSSGCAAPVSTVSRRAHRAGPSRSPAPPASPSTASCRRRSPTRSSTPRQLGDGGGAAWPSTTPTSRCGSPTTGARR